MNNLTDVRKNFDLILIGSGIGALTIASLMAQFRKKRILIIERHYEIGGYTHCFQRKGFTWDVGVHYLGMLKRGSPIRSLFDSITRNELKWSKIPDPYDTFVYPDLAYKFFSGKNKFIQNLLDLFPDEELAIKKYLKDVNKASTSYLMTTIQSSGSSLLKNLSLIWSYFNPIELDLTTKEYLDKNFRNEKLKSVLVSQWGDYGLPPSTSLFILHASYVRHFLEGSYFPIGGGSKIAESIRSIVEEHGGKFLTSQEVTQILIENGRAVGVRSRKLKNDDSYEDYFAPTIVSNTGVISTYLKLIPLDYPISFREKLKTFIDKNIPISSVALYIGLEKDPRLLGFNGGNCWIYNDYDHDKVCMQGKTWVDEIKIKPPMAFLSFPSLKDPNATKHTAIILSWTYYEPFKGWNMQPCMKRDKKYLDLKQNLSDSLISLVDTHYPGFAESVCYAEVSTPITNEFFTNHYSGAIYGLPFVKERFDSENLCWTDSKTPVPGLYLTGSDVYMSGVVSSMIGGIVTLGNLPDGLPFYKSFELHKLYRI